jgi:hypothetical protein
MRVPFADSSDRIFMVCWSFSYFSFSRVDKGYFTL